MQQGHIADAKRDMNAVLTSWMPGNDAARQAFGGFMLEGKRGAEQRACCGAG